MTFLISCFGLALQILVFFVCINGIKIGAQLLEKGLAKGLGAGPVTVFGMHQAHLQRMKNADVTGLDLAKQKLNEHIREAHAVGAYILAEKYMKQLDVVEAIQRAQEAKIKAKKQSEWANKAEQALDDIYD